MKVGDKVKVRAYSTVSRREILNARCPRIGTVRKVTDKFVYVEGERCKYHLATGRSFHTRDERPMIRTTIELVTDP